MKKNIKKLNPHYLFILALCLILGISIYKIYSWNQGVTLDYNPDDITEDMEVENMDDIKPLAPDKLAGHEDDGVTTVVCFGNAPFADMRNQASNVCSLTAKQADAVVYNCSIPDSYLSSKNYTFLENYAYDAFSFYWLTTVFTLNNHVIIDQAYDIIGNVPDEIKESIDLLQSIDFNTVDIIALCYDASDYFDGRPMYSDENTTDIQQFTGAMEAGIELIQQYFPHIRIIVMSPPYAFAIDQDGNYASSDIITYGQSTLSTYVIKQSESAYMRNVSFVDNLYGSIHEGNAPKYLTDNLHLNEDGRALLAKRLTYAIHRFDS